MAPLSLTFSFLSLWVLFVTAEPLHIPLQRISSSRKVDLNEIAERVNVKYGFTSRSSPRNRRASSSSVPTVNQDVDASYFASLSIGTPPQTLGVILDTGSSDLWLAGTSCSSCAGAIPIFDPSKSSSFQGGNVSPSSGGGTGTSLGSSVEIQYGSGSVAGSLAQDTVSMGGFTVNNQKLVNVDTIQGNILVADPQGASGLMGLAFTDLAQTQATPFWLQLTNNNQFSSPEISFFLSRSSNPNVQDVPGGVFTLGGTNSSLFTGSIEFHDIPTNPLLFWSLSLQAVQVNGKSANIQSSVQAAIDTGTSLIAGPTSDVTAIWAAVAGSGPSPSSPGFFNFPCNAIPSISLSFGGNNWPISPLDLVFTQEPTDSTKCIGSIFAVTVPPNSQTPSWIIGDTFLKNVYTVFRSTPPSVGFAQLSTAAGSPAAGGGGGGSSSSDTLFPTASLPTFTGLPNPTVTGSNTPTSGNTGAPGTTAGTGGAAQSRAVSTKLSILFVLASSALGCIISL